MEPPQSPPKLAKKSFIKRLMTRVWPTFIKRNIPRTLWARAFLAIVLPIAVMQFMVTWVFFNMHWETVTAKLAQGLVGDIAWAVSAYETHPTAENLAVISAQASRSMQLSIRLQPKQNLPNSQRHNLFEPLDRSIDHALSDAIDQPYWFDTTRYPGFVDIRIKVKEGTLRIIAPKDRAFATTGHIFILWMILATALLTLVAVLFIRNQVRAIERLAQAAEAFGRGEDDPEFKPYGATEVRAAAEAFLKMKARIGRHIEQRTHLLASVSHDLRTPLTRLKLELAMAPEVEMTQRMRSDVSEMAYMIDEYLAFARGEMHDNVDEISVRAFVESVDQSVKRAGYNLRLSLPEQDLRICVRENALQRAVTNLIMNGFHYGKHVTLSVDDSRARQADKRHVCLIIDDDGPGITPEKREDAFKPFSRLDEARNQNIKGVGLGLAIARDIVRAHGGELSLDQSPLGGLRAIVNLPLE
jgi:two-component system osmolarity sensor histidine kinase EnvZ